MRTASFNQYFAGYEIMSELGRGNARVLKARNRITGDLIAIKHFAFNTDAETLRRFQQESEIMTAIQHPYIVKIIDVHLDAELPYLVMELIEGGDLRKLLKDNLRLSIPEVIRLAEHMSEALEAIHSKGVVHRDLKPENIMYRQLPEGGIQFLLSDFGIAKLREESNTITGSSMLTFEYASPEQFTHSRAITGATDYYSLGVLLYECLTGSVPFVYEEGDLLGHINHVISHPVDLNRLPCVATFPRSLKLLLKGLLEKKPAERLCDPIQIRQLIEQATGELETDNSGLLFAKLSAAGQEVNAYGYLTSIPALQDTDTQPVLIPSKKTHNYFLRSAGMVLFLLILGLLMYFVFTDYKIPFLISEQAVNSFSHTGVDSNKQPVRSVDKQSIRNNKPIGFAARSVANQLYFDDFSNDQDSTWDIDKDQQREFAFENGKYVIKGYDSSFTYHSTKPFNIDISKDFTISVNARRRQGKSADGFGINYLGDIEKDAYFVFYISSDGYYKINVQEKDNTTTIVDWMKSANIHINDAMNTITIVKEADSVSYFINDVKELTLPYNGAFGNCFGLRVDGNQTVAFDQFILKGSR
jgi:serine/threonine protein kinase